MPAKKAWDYMKQDAQSLRDDNVSEVEIKQVMEDRLKKIPASSTLHRGKKAAPVKYKKGGVVKKGRKRII